ncbi:MAG TPA: transcriptional repressor [Candidatus Limivivens intestinipullorum]|uniref:Transcriptional repressor n=1 Tax=Candidatus Limivivens intestinipullorum TaxID=2840858 RepID=A0A9D1EVB1_9FIRM|nr:transcriptional repressor [Candidatus Limivivens intestinipullorum]
MCDKEAIIHELKRRRKRITEQRRIMIDVITEEDCKSFKELYVKIARRDPGIGQATVYRMLLTLEEIGAIERVQGYVRKDFGKEQISKEVSEET